MIVSSKPSLQLGRRARYPSRSSCRRATRPWLSCLLFFSFSCSLVSAAACGARHTRTRPQRLRLARSNPAWAYFRLLVYAPSRRPSGLPDRPDTVPQAARMSDPTSTKLGRSIVGPTSLYLVPPDPPFASGPPSDRSILCMPGLLEIVMSNADRRSTPTFLPLQIQTAPASDFSSSIFLVEPLSKGVCPPAPCPP